VLVPAPDYPLWTAFISLRGGTPVHYLCDETHGWQPDLDDIASKVTPRTRALVVINPNNPTGAVYTRETLDAVLEIARLNDLVVSDEIYRARRHPERRCRRPAGGCANSVTARGSC
jgi:alanine-synthesizing transaminase